MSTEADIVESADERRMFDESCARLGWTPVDKVLAMLHTMHGTAPIGGSYREMMAIAFNEITKLRAEHDAAVRDMRERAAMAVRNNICTISWPPQDGDELIDTLMAVVRALPDTPAVIATDGDTNG